MSETTVSGLNIFQIFYFYLPPSNYQGGPKDPRMRDNDAYDFWIYQMPYIRCQTFIIGMLVGYFLEKKKTIRIRRSINLVMWLVALISMSIALFGLKDWASGHQWALFPRAMYSAFARPLWAFGLSWIVIACYYGYGGLISTLMSLPIWVPLSRLSFCAYLVHILVIGILFGIDHGAVHFSGISNALIRTCLPVAILTFAVAVFWSCTFELPFAKLEMKLLAGKRTASAKDKKVAHINGTIDIVKTKI
ncbi:hypothetical protein RB195_016390 [Necator americanus]|uniref:Acyltransferase 3 domain-containing protein n=1 Tax=Necator americanus TaxID=51031 RepID=A0ABR1E967_NECAM